MTSRREGQDGGDGRACSGLHCLTELAMKTWRPGRTHDGAAYLEGIEGGELIWLTRHPGDGPRLRARLSVAHGDAHPSHRTPSTDTLRRVIQELTTRADLAKRDDPPPEPPDGVRSDTDDTGDTDSLIPSPTHPTAVARHFLSTWQDSEGDYVLRAWRGQWVRWHRTHWAELDPARIKAELYGLTERATYYYDGDGAEVRPWAPTRRKIGDLSEALAYITHLDEDVDPPAWLVDPPTSGGQSVPLGRIISTANGLLHLPTRTLYRHTPRYFGLITVPYEYDPDAPEPTAWLEFLDRLWPNDRSCIDALQEWFGVIISGRTDLQKILMMVGPARAGKGTIARILTSLIGPGNVASPTLTSLGTPFGLACLLGKPLAIISDARLGKGDSTAAVEALLSISGEDDKTVQRKYRPDWIGRLPTRFMIMSNELPRLADPTGVIVSRLVLLVLTQTWLGKEDVDLEAKLIVELPSIFGWALEGLDRVERLGRLTEPKSSAQAVTALRDSIAPYSAFVRQRIDRSDRNARTVIEDVWQVWREWCEDQGRNPGVKTSLGVNLRAAIPGLTEWQPHAKTTELIPGTNKIDRRRRYVGIKIRKVDEVEGDADEVEGDGTHTSPPGTANNGDPSVSCVSRESALPAGRAHDSRDTHDTDSPPLLVQLPTDVCGCPNGRWGEHRTTCAMAGAR